MVSFIRVAQAPILIAFLLATAQSPAQETATETPPVPSQAAQPVQPEPRSADAIKGFLRRARIALGGDNVVATARRSVTEVSFGSDFSNTTKMLRLGRGSYAAFQKVTIPGRPGTWGEEHVRLGDGTDTGKKVRKYYRGTSGSESIRFRGTASGYAMEIDLDSKLSAMLVTKDTLWTQLQDPITNWDIPEEIFGLADVSVAMNSSATFAQNPAVEISVTTGSMIHKWYYDSATALPLGRVFLNSEQGKKPVPALQWTVERWSEFEGLHYPSSQRLFAFRRPEEEDQSLMPIKLFQLNVISIGPGVDAAREAMRRELPAPARERINRALTENPKNLNDQEKLLRKFADAFFLQPTSAEACVEAFGVTRAPSEPGATFTLESLVGGSFTIDQLKGSVIVLEFWASWCKPCRHSLKLMDEFSKSTKGKPVKVFAVNTGEKESTGTARIKTAKRYWENGGYTFDTLIDIDGTAAKHFELQGYPLTVVIGPDGKVRKKYLGLSDKTVQELRVEVEQALATK